MKWIAIAIIACTSIGIGFWKAEILRQRMKDLQSVLLILGMLRGEVEYAISSMDEACASIGKRMESPFSDFFLTISKELKQMNGESLEEIWTRNLEVSLTKTALVETDLSILKNLGGRLGYLDGKMQVRILDYTKEEVLKVIEDLNQTIKTNTKLYQSMGVLGALSILIITI